jgi:uncharacterized RDD family membrane protein YckC
MTDLATAATGPAEAPTFFPDDTHVSWRRYWAHQVDEIALLLILVVLVVITGAINDVALAIALVLWFTVIHVAYYAYTQRRTGRSPGKRLLGIRVVDASGNVPSQAALVRRSIPLLVEYVLVLAWLGMMSSSYRQRLGDRWAKTYVILA